MAIHFKGKIDFFIFLFYLIHHNQTGYKDNHFILYITKKHNYVLVSCLYCLSLSFILK
jgi:hypothetical protein